MATILDPLEGQQQELNLQENEQLVSLFDEQPAEETQATEQNNKKLKNKKKLKKNKNQLFQTNIKTNLLKILFGCTKKLKSY